MPVLPGGLHVCPVVPPLGVGAVDPLDDVGSPPLAPARPGISMGWQTEGRSCGQSNRVLDHLGLLSLSPRSASIDRETETSAWFASFTPVLDAPAFWLQRPLGSLR